MSTRKEARLSRFGHPIAPMDGKRDCGRGGGAVASFCPRGKRGVMVMWWIWGKISVENLVSIYVQSIWCYLCRGPRLKLIKLSRRNLYIVWHKRALCHQTIPLLPHRTSGREKKMLQAQQSGFFFWASIERVLQKQRRIRCNHLSPRYVE